MKIFCFDFWLFSIKKMNGDFLNYPEFESGFRSETEMEATRHTLQQTLFQPDDERLFMLLHSTRDRQERFVCITSK